MSTLNSHRPAREVFTVNEEILNFQQLCLSSPIEIILFWNANKTRLPILFQLTQILLSILPTSAVAERNFNISGDLLRAKRANILPHRAHKALFVNSNINLLHSNM